MLRHSILRLASAFGIAAACTLAPVANATTLIANGYANGSEAFLLSAPFPPVVNPVNAGGFTGTFGGVPLLFWCADLQHTFSFGTSYDYTASLYANNALSRLFTEVGGSAAAVSTTNSSAAFQLAIWEILFESNITNPYNLGTGNFEVANDEGNTAAVTLANLWLQNLNNYAPSTQLIFLTSTDGHQNFITDTTIPSRLIIPEPSSLPLLGIALLAIAFGLRRRVPHRLD